MGGGIEFEFGVNIWMRSKIEGQGNVIEPLVLKSDEWEAGGSTRMARTVMEGRSLYWDILRMAGKEAVTVGVFGASGGLRLVCSR